MKKNEKRTTKLSLKKLTVAKLNNLNKIRGGGIDADNTDLTPGERPTR